MHTGTIVTVKTVDQAQLFNLDGTSVVGAAVTISSVGMGGCLKQLVWSGVSDGIYFLTLLIGTNEVSFGIKVKFNNSTWIEVTGIDEIIEEGGDGPWGEPTVTQIDANSPPETMLDTINLIGPKSVKTKDLEITAHGLNGVESLHKNLRNPIPISLAAITSTIARPKRDNC